MKKIIFLLFFPLFLSAQNITVFSGYQRLSVTPEIATKFNLKQSEILTPEKFQEVYQAMYQITVKSEPLAVIGDGSAEWPFRPLPLRPGEKFKIVNDTIYTDTGRRFFEKGKWVFIPKK